MLVAPWLGALADRRGQRKLWLGLFTLLGVVATALLATVGRGEWALALPVFVLASIGFFGGSSFQDALLVQVATPAESNRVSAYGYAAGYLGGGLLFLRQRAARAASAVVRTGGCGRCNASRLRRCCAVVGAVHLAAVSSCARGAADR